jgi:hypothetical protein
VKPFDARQVGVLTFITAKCFDRKNAKQIATNSQLVVLCWHDLSLASFSLVANELKFARGPSPDEFASSVTVIAGNSPITVKFRNYLGSDELVPPLARPRVLHSSSF